MPFSEEKRRTRERREREREREIVIAIFSDDTEITGLLESGLTAASRSLSLSLSLSLPLFLFLPRYCQANGVNEILHPPRELPAQVDDDSRGLSIIDRRAREAKVHQFSLRRVKREVNEISRTQSQVTAMIDNDRFRQLRQESRSQTCTQTLSIKITTRRRGFTSDVVKIVNKDRDLRRRNFPPTFPSA